MPLKSIDQSIRNICKKINPFKNLFKTSKILTLRIFIFVEKHFKFMIKAFGGTRYFILSWPAANYSCLDDIF